MEWSLPVKSGLSAGDADTGDAEEQEALSHLLLSWEAEILGGWRDITGSMSHANVQGDDERKNCTEGLKPLPGAGDSSSWNHPIVFIHTKWTNILEEYWVVCGAVVKNIIPWNIKKVNRWLESAEFWVKVTTFFSLRMEMIALNLHKTGTVVMTKRNIWQWLAEWMPKTTCGLCLLFLKWLNASWFLCLSWMIEVYSAGCQTAEDLFLFSASDFCFMCHLLTIITVIWQVFVSFPFSPVRLATKTVWTNWKSQTSN